MSRFSVRSWLSAGGARPTRAELSSARPLDFSGVENLEAGAARMLVEATGARSLDDLLEWLEPNEVNERVQKQLVAALNGGLAPSIPRLLPPDPSTGAFHPIVALDLVLEEYRDHLRSEFRAKDASLRAALEEALERPLFLAQEPFFQVHRPFEEGRRWRELSLDPRLAAVMETRSRSERAYLHQSLAIEELLTADPRPVVVTTGTNSGKTEAFLLPVIQNAIADATRFRRAGLTAILVYPMNALANDQEQRIRDYLAGSGFSGTVTVARYDRGTSQAKRDELRRSPPHVLLTNYMMLEYLLVRPADRDDIFANHRCRYLVLDEVHTYRGTLGSNIAFLVRRLRAHLGAACQDWAPEVQGSERASRFPKLVPIGTSATIKSLDGGANPDVARQERDAAVQDFFARLTGAAVSSIRVFGEAIRTLEVPPGATYSAKPRLHSRLDPSDLEAVRQTLCALAGLPSGATLEEAARGCKILFDLNRWLVGSPSSISQIAERIRAEVPERSEADADVRRQEVEAALVAGAALPDGVPGVLRLRAHRFIRGGWRFHRCVNPGCGRLYPMGEERCECGHATAPLHLCRSCGADYLQLVGDAEPASMRPGGPGAVGLEWMVYEPARFEGAVAEDGEEDEEGPEEAPQVPRRRRGARAPTQMRGRPVLQGSLDPGTLLFSTDAEAYPLRVVLAPARNRCLCCGGFAGSRNVVTPVALGTSAAVMTLGEGLVEALAREHRASPSHDGKERLLVFSDSRQDAAHQARFILFASRFDRMRRRLVRILTQEGELPIQRSVELLGQQGVEERDNPWAQGLQGDWIPDESLARIRAWEEAPLLEDLSVNAGYRGTLVNLGLVGVRYHRLDEYVQARGGAVAASLGISGDQLEHVCRCLLDEMRKRSAVSREMLRYHERNPSCPDHVRRAQWERRVKAPRGYACSSSGSPETHLDRAEIPAGITLQNAWRRPGVGGSSPSLERILRNLCARFGAPEPGVEQMERMLDFLLDPGRFLVAADLFGARERRRLLQVNAETIRIVLLTEEQRARCDVCGMPLAGAPIGSPCPRCHGSAVRWTDAEVAANRTVRRIRSPEVVPLVAGEHTAQVPHAQREELEASFKAPASESKVNLLACSPTLEMGIDVGGLDAVVLRNIPPRPDNYAQRGGRAGRRSRVGLVVGYARSTPHDQYFYDHPEEMISGEVPAPTLALGNRDVLLRHIHAIIFGAAEPGLSGKMVDYVSPQGEPKEEAIAALVEAVEARFGDALAVARGAFGEEILQEAGLGQEELRRRLEELPGRIRDVMERTARQVIELRQALDAYSLELLGRAAATRAGELVARLLGIRTERQRGSEEADDRSAGYPLRRFAEFGILPGYEFPTEPAAVRLLGDEHEEDPVTVARRFGIAQFQPDAQVYARTRRWKVIGLDTASPWNPRSDGPSWTYRLCRECKLRFRADHPRCPRCGDDSPGRALPASELAGFLARRDESPVLDEEERYAQRNLVQVYPQWDGDVVARYGLELGWSLRLSRREEIEWVNEGRPPSETEIREGAPYLHQEARGFLLCATCGRMLTPPEPPRATRGRRNARGADAGQEIHGHRDDCPQRATVPTPLAIVTASSAEVLRLLCPVPPAVPEAEVKPWGLSLGYALRMGMRHLYMLDGPEIEFTLEGPWKSGPSESRIGLVSLTFIDPSLGGTGYLPRISSEFHQVARRALVHLDHEGCETACYRCLKSYQNQRFHEFLRWPLAHPYLEALAAAPPSPRPLETGDIADPRPWLEAYALGLGSPLELRFWRLFEQHGFTPEKQVPVAPGAGESPISIADFAVPERRLAIYVDGAAWHTGANLRRDRAIRDRLRTATPPWTVVELRARDLGEGVPLVARLRALAAP